MTRCERARVIAFAALVTLVPSAALAQDGEPDPLVPFEEGRALVHAGRYAEALARFEESYRIKATSGALINMADCYEKLGRYASAAAAFDRAAKLAEASDQTERAKEAADRRAAVEALVSHLTLTAPSDASLTVDGEAVSAGTPLALDGGEHVVRIVVPCRAPRESRVAIGLSAEERTLAVEPGPRSEEPSCGGPPPTMSVVSRPEEPPSSWTTRKTVAVVMGSVGIVALGAGVGFGLSASSKKDELESACRDYPRGCPQDRRSELEATYDDASRAAAYSTFGVIAGVVFLGAAVGLWLTAPKTSARIATSSLLVTF